MDLDMIWISIRYGFGHNMDLDMVYMDLVDMIWIWTLYGNGHHMHLDIIWVWP